MIPGFTTDTHKGLSVQSAGTGPPVLMLHGFPQTSAMWAKIAPTLAQDHTVICPDLPGYGNSTTPDAAGSSFRNMARAMTDLMTHLGHTQFAVIGHDRGARVAHRLCLDAPTRVTQVALMDIIPTHTLLSDLRFEVARDYYHWFFLAQPEPFPDSMIAADPDAYFQACLLGFGGATLDMFDPEQLSAYRTAWRNPDRIRGMCNDYRAGLGPDLDDDTADLGKRITCPTTILYGADGVMARHYDVPATWSAKCTHMTAQAIPGGHFFPDTAPQETLNALTTFLIQATP